MLKKFAKYVSQNMLGMVGMSVYILADTFFISQSVGANGITALNLVLPIYNLIFAIGAMIGVGSAIRFVIERHGNSSGTEGYFFHALVWAFLISLIFIFVGIFLPDKLIALLGGDSSIIAVGRDYTRIFMIFSPFFMWNHICCNGCNSFRQSVQYCFRLYINVPAWARYAGRCTCHRLLPDYRDPHMLYTF